MVRALGHGRPWVAGAEAGGSRNQRPPEPNKHFRRVWARVVGGSLASPGPGGGEAPSSDKATRNQKRASERG
eukprot:12183300-Heterocapsa_arctica.AAC.1